MAYPYKRKFLVRFVPDLANIKSVHYERYFLLQENGIEIRVQSRGNDFEIERKSLSETGEEEISKYQISREAFGILKQAATEAIVRESYLLSEDPHLAIKIYQGKFQGFIRAEVAFATPEEADRFAPFEWMGREITDSPLGRDSQLLAMSMDDVEKLIHETA